MLDYHALRTEVKASLLQRWQQLDIAADPLVWAWVAYAFSVEGAANNPLFGQAGGTSNPRQLQFGLKLSF